MIKLIFSATLTILTVFQLNGQNRKLVPFLKKNGSYVIVDSATMKIEFPIELDFAFPFSDKGWAAKNQKWGIIDHTGDFIVEPMYDDLNLASDDLAIVKINGKVGLLRIDGTKITELIYSKAKVLNDNCIKVSKIVNVGKENDEYELWGIIDINGNELFPCIYDEIKFGKQGIIFTKGEKIGFANSFGKKLTDVIYDVYSINNPNSIFQSGIEIVSKNDLYGAIDSFGNEFIPFKYGDLSEVAPRNKATRTSRNFIGGVASEKDSTLSYVLLDSTGKSFYQGDLDVLYEIAYKGYTIYEDSVGIFFTNGRITKPIGTFGATLDDIKFFGRQYFAWNDKLLPNNWELFDRNGGLLVKFQAQLLDSYSDGIISLKRNDKWGVIDLQKKVVIPFKYTSVSLLGAGLIEVCKGGTCAVLDKEKKVIWPMTSDTIGIYGDNSEIIAVKKGNTINLFDRFGKALTSSTYDNVSDDIADYLILIVSNEKKYGLLSFTGAKITELEFDDIDVDDIEEGVLIVKKNKKYGLINKNGQVLVPLKYDEVSVISDEIKKYSLFAEIRLNGKFGLYECGVGEIIPPNFDEDDIDLYGGLILISSDFKVGYFVDFKGREYKEK